MGIVEQLKHTLPGFELNPAEYEDIHNLLISRVRRYRTKEEGDEWIQYLKRIGKWKTVSPEELERLTKVG